MNKFITKIAALSVGLAMAIGVGVAAGSNNKAAKVKAETATYHHTFSAKPDTGNNVALSSINWNITATELGNYNSQYYAGVQIGTKKASGEICLTSSSAWGAQSGTYKDKTVISEIRVWMNKGGGTTAATVTIGGTAATSDGTEVVKNSSASSYSDTTCVSFTPAVDHDTGVVVITVNASGGAAGYICAMEIDCEEPAGPSEDPAFTLDKNTVSLTLGGSSTTVTATPNEYVSGSATYTWSRTSGDDCVTLTNANTATVTIAPKGTALSASCTLTISVTGCTSKTVSVTVKKVSTAENPFTITEARALINAGVAADMTGVYVHGFVSQVDSFSSPYITYWISDDATTTDQFEVYKGKNLNNINFSGATDLEVGYEVVIFGNIKDYQGTDEFDKDNYIVSLIRPNTFEITTSTNGLILSTDEVGTSGSVTLTTAAKKKGTNVTVSCGTGTATVVGNVVTLSNVDADVEINAEIVDADVTSIALSGYPSKLALDDEFSYAGLIVTGTYDDWVSQHTSEAINSGYTVDDSNVDMTTEGTYEVTVTYGGASASYEVTVADIFDNSKGEYHLAEQSDIKLGEHIIIAVGDAETNYAVGFFNNGNNFPQAEATKNANGTISKTGVTEFELVQGTETGTFGMKIVAGTYADYYAYAVGGTSSNHWKASTTLDNKGSFTFTKVSDSDWTITASVSGRNTVRYNSGSSLFSCYASGNQSAVTVYAFKTFTVEADEYAAKFLKANGENFATCSATKGQWSTLKTAFGGLTSGAQALFTGADHVDPSTYKDSTEISVAHAVCRYDDAVTKDSTLRGENEFMGRINAGTLVLGNGRVSIESKINGTNATTVIIVIASVTLLGVGGYFFIRKKKEQ